MPPCPYFSCGKWESELSERHFPYNYFISANDTITIGGTCRAPAIPEFSTIGIIPTIIVIGLGTALIMKRKSK